nr:GNAT family N-acetyltransferase [Streptomyces sp. 846.5]
MALAGDGTVIGIIVVVVEDGPSTIDTIAVHPDHQRCRIGSALLAQARAASDVAFPACGSGA